MCDQPTDGGASESGGESSGGDPACWASLVCAECGAVTTEGHHEGCALAEGRARAR